MSDGKNYDDYGYDDADYRERRVTEDYEDAYLDEDPAGAETSRAGAHEAAEPERGAATAAAGAESKLPLRGLAMVLIAVAVLLLLWGVYALTSGKSEDKGAKEDPAASASDQPGQPGAQSGQSDRPGQPAPGAPEDRAGGQAEGRPGADPQDPNGPHPGGENAAPAPGAPNPGAAAGAPGAPGGVQRINVLNNSTVPDLAAQVSGSLRQPGVELGEVGNLPGEVLTVPQNTVFFRAGNAEAEQQARELADRIGGVAREFDPALPREAAGDRDLTVVLATPVQL